MKFKFSIQQYQNISKILSATALSIFAIFAILHACRTYAHVDYVGPEGANNATRDQQEARDLQSDQGKTPEQFGDSLHNEITGSQNDNSTPDYSSGDNYTSGRDYNFGEID